MGKKIEEDMVYIHIYVNEGQKEWISKNGNASHCIRRLIDKDMNPFAVHITDEQITHQLDNLE